MRPNKERKRQALVKQREVPPYEDLSATHPMTYGSFVFFNHHAEYKADADNNISISTDMVGYAPPDSELARSWAAIPLLAPMVLLPAAMAIIGKFAIGDPTLTMILVVLGLGVGVGIAACVYLLRRRTVTQRVPASAAEAPLPTPDAIVVLPTEAVSPTTPPEVLSSPEPVSPDPGAEAGAGTGTTPQT